MSITGTPEKSEPTYIPNCLLCLACEGARQQQTVKVDGALRNEDKERATQIC